MSDKPKRDEHLDELTELGMAAEEHLGAPLIPPTAAAGIEDMQARVEYLQRLSDTVSQRLSEAPAEHRDAITKDLAEIRKDLIAAEARLCDYEHQHGGRN